MESKAFTPTIESTYKKRRNIIRTSIVIILLLAIAGIALVVLYDKSSKVEYMKYNESSSVDYKVYLKKNDFFEDEYLSTDKKYIASLIKDIQAEFKYNLDMPKSINNYAYLYNIDAQVNVMDKNDKRMIYTDTNNLVSFTGVSQYTSQDLSIDEDVKIDYNKYNNLIKKFVNTYDLDGSESILTVNMNIKIAKTKAELEEAKSTQVSSLEIPLTTNTVGIELVSNTEKGLESDLFIKKTSKKKILVYIAAGIAVADAFYLLVLIIFYLATRTDQTIFEGKVNRIIRTYKGYIQKVDSQKIALGDYQPVHVNSFNDLLEIRDTLQEPILMIENKTNTAVYFLIPSQTGIAYIFSLGTDKSRKRLTDGTTMN